MMKISLKKAKFQEPNVRLCIQDSTNPAAVLYDTLVQGFQLSKSGLGVYAFASYSGVETLFESKEFCDFIKEKKYTLVVGMDAITNSKCVLLLKGYSDKNANLRVYAYINDKPNSIMHSKFSWFRIKNTGRLVLGSGNLTLSGLRFNTEAYVDCSINSIDCEPIQMEIDNWFSNSKSFLFELDDKKVINRALENDKIQRDIRKVAPKAKAIVDEKIVNVINPSESDEIDLENEWIFGHNAEILVAEIPRSGNRWKQVNFSKEIYEGFFGADEKTSSRFILIKPVLPSGELGNIERRPNIRVISSNYRFEFSQAVGKYPDNGRPIVIVAKVGLSTFIYEIVLPGSEYYQELLVFLDNKQISHNGKMRRLIFSTNTIIKELPKLLILRYFRN